MDDSLPNPSSQNETSNSNSSRRVRGPTRLHRVAKRRAANQRPSVHFLPRSGRACGPNRAEFNTFLAMEGRTKASILINNWKLVPKSVKDLIWQSVKCTYEVPDDELVKRRCLQIAGDGWKAFKTRLANDYIHGEKHNLSPLDEFDFINLEDWEKFYEMRTSHEFEEKRKRGKETQAKNLHPHILSRGGYDTLEEKIMQEKRKQRQEALQGDTSIEIVPPSPPSRDEKWILARTRKSGEYTSKATEDIAQKIGSLKEGLSQGTFVPSARNDILTTALGKQDHPGRVLAEGRGVGIRHYWGSYSHGNKHAVVTQDQLEAFREQILNQVFQQMGSQQCASFGTSNTQPPPCTQHVSTHESCVDESTNKYQFYVADPYLRLVASGDVYEESTIIHNVPIPDGCKRVEVKTVTDAAAQVPFITAEVQTVGQALNQFILWPSRLVKIASKKEQLPSTLRTPPLPQGPQEKEFAIDTQFEVDILPQGPQEKEFQIDTHDVDTHDVGKDVVPPQELEPDIDVMTRAYSLHLQLKKTNAAVMVEIDCDITGLSESTTTRISASVILDVCLGNRMLCVSALQLWMLILHRLCVTMETKEEYGFMDPTCIHIGRNEDDVKSYINKRLCPNGGIQHSFYLAPYLDCKHWQLLLFCPRQNIVVFFCSLGWKPKERLIRILHAVMDSYQTLSGKHLSKRKLPQILRPKCPKQRGSTECGFYVMKLMLTIITAKVNGNWMKMFDNSAPLTDDEIEDIQKRWTKFLLEVVDSQKKRCQQQS